MRKYRRILRVARHEWRGLVLILGLGLGFSLAAVLQPWPLQFLVDVALGTATAGTAGRDTWVGAASRLARWQLVLLAALASLVVFLLETVLEIGLTRAWALVGRRLVNRLGAELFARLQRLSLAFHARRSTGDALARLHEDSWCIYTLADALLVSPLQHSATLLMLGVVAWTLDPSLALLTMALAPALAVLALVFGHRLEARALTFREADAGVMAYLHQALGAVPVVQAFGMRSAARRRFDRVAQQAAHAEQQEALWKALFASAGGVILAAGTAVILFVGGQRVMAGALSVGTLLVFLGYLRSLEHASRSILTIMGNVRAAGASAQRVVEVLEASDDVEERADARDLPAPQGTGRHVVFDAVTFGYAPGAPVLRELSLAIPAGETLALVGRTGAGKSTLASLLPRFYDPWRGRILVDGIDVRDVRLNALRSEISIVSQEPLLFPATIAENIAYGRSGARHDEVEAAARAAQAHEFISTLPDGYATVIGERGATLSGGERQRIAIARALLKNAPILILDEPTSALDTVSERAMLDALVALFAGRTVLIIAHRFSTLRLAHRLAVLEEGRIAECGPEDDLLRRGGTYSRLRRALANREVDA